MKKNKDTQEKEEPQTAQDLTDVNENKPVEETVNTDCTDEKAALNSKIDELNDKYLRLYSEFDNYRKRTLKERIDLSKTASEELIVELLPVLDDFARAEKSFDVTDNHEALLEGVQLIYNKLKNTLTSKGLKEISAKGEPFDTDFHEAITHFPAEDPEMKNKVIDEIQTGYKLHDKVIRFAKVVVGS
jgi:molecular chaperone GrpE